AAAAGLLGAEAVAAVHRTIASRLERHLGVATAVGAHRRIHLPRPGRVAAATTVPAAATTVSATAAVSAPDVTTGGLARAAAMRAALRLVGEAAARVELLIVGSEDELRAAIHARQIPVGVWHLTTSSNVSLSSGRATCWTYATDWQWETD